MSITGADFLGKVAKDKIAAAKQKITNAVTELDNAFGKIDGAAEHAERVAQQVSSEADGLLADLGQLTNGGPG